MTNSFDERIKEILLVYPYSVDTKQYKSASKQIKQLCLDFIDEAVGEDEKGELIIGDAYIVLEEGGLINGARNELREEIKQRAKELVELKNQK